MPTSSPFSYFHGTESEQFSYYRIPRLLITGKQFRPLSTDAKLLYGLLLDRMGLSARNGWYDELGRNCLPSLMGAYSVDGALCSCPGYFPGRYYHLQGVAFLWASDGGV